MGPEGIREAGIERIASILGRGIAEQVFAQLGRPFPASSGEQSGLDHFVDSV
jgi:hypothetical protein